MLSCGLFAAPLPPTTVLAPTATASPSSSPPPPATETPAPTGTPAPNFKRVLIVSFDGLRPDAIAEASMTHVLGLIQTGAYTFGAQTIMPSVTLPAHTSMLTGACPAKHIVRWNEYVPQNGYALGVDIFDLAHAAGLRTVMVVGKEKLRQITEPASADYFAFVDETDKIKDPLTIEQIAIRQMREGFGLMFVHFPNGDLRGHEYGWMSSQQLKQYARDDEALGSILESLKKLELYDSTLILITADHGGHDTTHGSNMLEDMTIPWVAAGTGILPLPLTTQVYITDTAATAAFALGLPIPPEWDGMPVKEAFGLPIEERTPACQ